MFQNIKEAFILYFDDGKFNDSQLSYEIDFSQYFIYYKVLNSKSFASRIGMNPTLVSQYIRGHKKPLKSQSQRILNGIDRVGQELAEMSGIYELVKDKD